MMMKKLSYGFAVLFAAGALLLSGMTAFAAENAEAVGAESFEAVSAQADEESAVAAGYPEITRFDCTSSGLKVSWSAYPGAARYRLYVKNGGWTKIAETTGTSALYSGLADGESRVYTVRALNSRKEFVSSYNKSGRQYAYYKPLNVKAESAASGAVTVSWSSYNSSEIYNVRKNENGRWLAAVRVNGTKFTDSAAFGTEVYYGVARVNAANEILGSYSYTNKLTPLAQPEITEIQNGDSGAAIYFSKPAGAVKTRIYHLSGGKWVKLAQVEGTSYVHKTPLENAAETYTVRCLDANGKFCTGYNTTGYKNTFYAIPKISSITNTKDGALLRWSQPEGTLFKIYRRNESGWELLGSSTDGSYTDSTAVGGAAAVYKLRIYSSDGKKMLAAEGYRAENTFVEEPEIKSMTNTVSGVQIKWNACAGAAYYRVYVYDGGWKNQITTASTSFVDKNAKSGVKSVYTVRALDEKKKFVTQYNKDGWTHTFYAAPKLTTVKKANGGVTIEWESINGIENYRVYRKTSDGSWSRIVSSVSGTKYTDKKYSSSKLYSYTVRCLKENEPVSAYINNSLLYRDGSPAQGLAVIDGKKYYYNSDGTLAKNKIVGSASEGYYYTGEDGIICESAEIKYAVDFVVKNGRGSTPGEKLRSCFYALTSYSYITQYHFPDNGSEYKQTAADMFKNKGGSCFGWGGAFAAVAKVLGYETRAARGQITMVAGGYGAHGWTEVKIGGVWYICDADMQKYSSSYDSYYLKSYSTYPASLIHGAKYSVKVKNGVSVWG